MIEADIHEDAPGQLIIAGGALDQDNSAVFRVFIDGVADGGPITLIGAASGSLVSSMAGFAAGIGATHGGALVFPDPLLAGEFVGEECILSVVASDD